VIGAEKHDAGAAYPSYNGFFDELRLSSVVRYNSNFVRPQMAFDTDAITVALYHFDEGTGTRSMTLPPHQEVLLQGSYNMVEIRPARSGPQILRLPAPW
jgi:hypothetical protein